MRTALFRILFAAALFALVLARSALAADLYLDPDQPVAKRVADLIARLTLEEKAAQLNHLSSVNTRLGIPNWGGWNQCLHGVYSKQPTTEFTTCIGMAASFDPALIKTMADAMADEGRALYNSNADGPHGKHGLVYRAPVINMSRNPLWGRIQECWGEDPCLTSRMAVAYVRGLQGDDPRYLKLAATLKHFAVNNVEKDRLRLSATVPERMLHEYWLAQFKAAVVEGHACSLMAAYNAINGTPCAVNKVLLTQILRGMWGFQGFVVSDLGGIKYLISPRHWSSDNADAAAQALLAGCDYDDAEFQQGLPAAVKAGIIPETALDIALTRVLTVAFRLGAFDPPERVPFSKIGMEMVNSAEHRALAGKVEEESIVLLKNDGGLLPLASGTLRKIAVIGPASDQPEYGNYYGATPVRIGPAKALAEMLGPGVTLLQAKGCGFVEPADPAAIDQAVQAARQADVALLFLGTNARVEGEGRDRSDLALPGAQEQLLEAVIAANPKTVLILSNGGPLSIPFAKAKLPAILEEWYPGEEGGHALARVLFGQVNPAGRLPYTIYESAADVPPPSEYDITKGFTYLYFQGKPQFPFGHGLSYTTYAYENLKLSAESVRVTGQVQVSCEVTNTGSRAGDEVVQLYTHAEKSSVVRPIKELRCFQRIHLDPGEKKEVSFALPASQLAFYDIGSHGFIVEPGTYDLMAGASSEDIRLRTKLEVTARAGD